MDGFDVDGNDLCDMGFANSVFASMSDIRPRRTEGSEPVLSRLLNGVFVENVTVL